MIAPLVIGALVLACGGFFAGVKYAHSRNREMELHGPHEHVCACGNAWQHDDFKLPLGGVHDAHVCSQCGEVVLEIHRVIEPEVAT